MITVTDSAKKLLKHMLLTKVDNFFACLRLTSPQKGELGIGIDVEQPGDLAIEFEGAKLLLVNADLAASLDNTVLDTAETPEGPELVIEGSCTAS